jgi:ferric-dicitrate binding protein FerR (iron transport regulator)
MPLPRLTPKAQDEAFRRERRSQLRGLLLLAAIVLAIILLRADRQAIFHSGWWRF